MVKSYGKVTLRGGYWEVTCEPHVMIRLKRTFSGISPRRFGTVRLSDTLENCRELVWFLQRFPMEVEERERLEQRAIDHQIREEDIHKLIVGDYKPREFELAIPAREYQAVAADLALRTGGLLVADDVGIGKTLCGICMLTDPRTRPALVVTLTHLPKQWEDEIHRFAPELRTHIIKKGTPYDVTKVRRKTVPFPDVLITNYHKLAGWAETLAPIINSVVYDEVQELRHGHLSQKGTAAFYLSNSVKWRIGLSATPIFNYGGEIYNVIEATQPDALGTEAEFTREWCNAYSEKKSIQHPKVFGTYLRDQGLMLRRTREDVGRELPDLLKVPHHIDCDQKALDAIKGRATELAKVILNQNPLEKGAKFKAAEELSWRLRQATGISKAPYVAAFVRLLIESGESVVLYGWHRECFVSGTQVIMYNGTTKAVEDVVVGDVLMGPDSRPRHVHSLVQGHGHLLRVIPKKGAAWTCSANHTLALHYGENKNSRHVTMPASEYTKLSQRSKRSYTLYRAPIVYFEETEDPPEPWLLGYWLGDGASWLCQGVRIATSDHEVVAEVKKIAHKHGLCIRKNACSNSDTTSFYTFSSGRYTGGYGRNKIRNLFFALNLDRNKHIPHKYKTASVEVRREILAGLLDSDGHVFQGQDSAGSATFANTNERLALDTAFICRSLGLAAHVRFSKRGATGLSKKPSHIFVVNISGDLTTIPTRIARKQAPKRRQIKNVLRTGFTIKPAGVGDYYGFEVDGDHLFLLDDFTAVHNCYSLWLEMLDDLNPVMYTGTESVTKKQAARDAFVEGRSPLLIMSLRSGAGLDGLQHNCRTVVFGELDWSPGVLEQCAGRIHRDGQASKVIAYYLLADSGSDPVIASVLGIKRSQIEGIRDPERSLIEKLDTGGDNIKQLAAAYLGVELPELEPPDEKEEEPVQVITTGGGIKVHTVPLPKLENTAAQLTGSFDLVRLNIREVTAQICGWLALLKNQFSTAVVVTVSKDPKTTNLLKYNGYQQLFEVEAPVPTFAWAQQPDLITASAPTGCKTIWEDLLSSSLAQNCLELLPAGTKFIDAARAAGCNITVVTDNPRYEEYATTFATK